MSERDRDRHGDRDRHEDQVQHGDQDRHEDRDRHGDRDRHPRSPVPPSRGYDPQSGAEAPGRHITSPGQERRDTEYWSYLPGSQLDRSGYDEGRRPPVSTADLYRPDNDRHQPPEDPYGRRRQDHDNRYRPDYNERHRSSPEDLYGQRRQDHIPGPTDDWYRLERRSGFSLSPRWDRRREGDNERQRSRPEDSYNRRQQEPRPIPPPAGRHQPQAGEPRDDRQQEPHPIPSPARRHQPQSRGPRVKPPVEFPRDLPVRPTEGKPKVPKSSTIAPGHLPVYLAICDNPDDRPTPNQWSFYTPYANGETGTLISANVVAGKWAVVFSRNYEPANTKYKIWFFYLGQVSQASVKDFSHLRGREPSKIPDGELEEVTRVIPLPRSELRVSFALDNTISPHQHSE